MTVLYGREKYLLIITIDGVGGTTFARLPIQMSYVTNRGIPARNDA